MEADYEKLERRSRIRTARARQINPQVIERRYEILGGVKPQFWRQIHQKGGCRLESGASDRFPGPSSLPTIGEFRIWLLTAILCPRNWNRRRSRVTWTDWPCVYFSIQVICDPQSTFFFLPTSILDLIEHNICSHGEGGDTSPKRGMTREALAGTQVE